MADQPGTTIEMPLSDANDLDAVVHALGMEDSDTTPAEAVAELHAEIERLRSALGKIAAQWPCASRPDMVRLAKETLGL